ncbi:MAG: sporulation protein YtxC [Clostridia bacterium]|nr:sporulation protein YtxC [Clostridia bacterium]
MTRSKIIKFNNAAECQRDFYELIDYLTLYVNMQEALIDCIKISVIDNNYTITDADNKVIFSFIEYDDTLIDALVMLAPKRIEIFNPAEFRNNELIKTIINIFKERVEINYNIISDAI